MQTSPEPSTRPSSTPKPKRGREHPPPPKHTLFWMWLTQIPPKKTRNKPKIGCLFTLRGATAAAAYLCVSVRSQTHPAVQRSIHASSFCLSHTHSHDRWGGRAHPHTLFSLCTSPVEILPPRCSSESPPFSQSLRLQRHYPPPPPLPLLFPVLLSGCSPPPFPKHRKSFFLCKRSL